MGIAERRIREKEVVRASILKASWKIIMREGWQALSIRKIADAIEYSAPVIYDHFNNKEAILQEFAEQGFQKLNKSLNQAIASHSVPEKQIEALANAYLNFAANNKKYYEIMYGLGMPSCDVVKKTSELLDFTEILQRPINKLIEDNQKNIDPLRKLKTFWSMLHGLVSINRLDDTNAETLNRKVLKDFTNSFIADIKA